MKPNDVNEFAVVFDNYDLRLIPDLILESRQPNEIPDFDLDSYSLVRRDGEVVMGRKFNGKDITITGYILAPTRQAYEQDLDELKYRLLTPLERPLVVAQRGIQTLYTATVSLFAHKFIEGGKARIIITFRASNPFGRDSTTTVVNVQNVTTSNYNFNELILGSSRTFPTFRATLNSVTDGTAQTIQFGNSRTGQFIAITRDWIEGDRIVVNTDTNDVFVNEVPQDYNGVFPYFEPRTATAYYSDTFEERDISMSMEYQKQYI